MCLSVCNVCTLLLTATVSVIQKALGDKMSLGKMKRSSSPQVSLPDLFPFKIIEDGDRKDWANWWKTWGRAFMDEHCIGFGVHTETSRCLWQGNCHPHSSWTQKTALEGRSQSCPVHLFVSNDAEPRLVALYIPFVICRYRLYLVSKYYALGLYILWFDLGRLSGPCQYRAGSSGWSPNRSPSQQLRGKWANTKSTPTAKLTADHHTVLHCTYHFFRLLRRVRELSVARVSFYSNHSGVWSFELPSNLALKALKPHRWISLIMILWSIAQMYDDLFLCNVKLTIIAAQWGLSIIRKGCMQPDGF